MSRPVIDVLQDGTGVVEVLVPGFPGADGQDGTSVPTGGATGQLLAKASNANYDFTWTTPRELASEAEAQAGVENTKIMTPLRVAQALVDRVRQTRAISTGTGLTGGGDLSADRTLGLAFATQGQAQAGLDNATVMTPLRTAEAISFALAGRPTEVDVATEAEALAGVSNVKVMTPLRTAQAIAAGSGASVVPVSRQVLAGTGLSGGGALSGDVTLSAAIATTEEAVSGSNNTKLMTPLRVAEATADVVRTGRQIIAGSGLTGGGTLASDRTLSADYASQAEAQAGTENTKLMTPLRVKEAIEALGGVGGSTTVTGGTAINAVSVSGGYRIDASISSISAAQNGTAENTLMSPERVHQAITARVVNNLTSLSTTDPVSAVQANNLNQAKADKSTQIIAGSGLSGGGALTADRTLSVQFATAQEVTAGTVANKAVAPAALAAAGIGGSGGGWEVVNTSGSTGVNAVSGQAVFCPSSVTSVTLPLNPGLGDRVIVGRELGSTSALTLVRNGQKIMGLSENMALDYPDVAVTLLFTGSAQGWRII